MTSGRKAAIFALQLTQGWTCISRAKRFAFERQLYMVGQARNECIHLPFLKIKFPVTFSIFSFTTDFKSSTWFPSVWIDHCIYLLLIHKGASQKSLSTVLLHVSSSHACSLLPVLFDWEEGLLTGTHQQLTTTWLPLTPHYWNCSRHNCWHPIHRTLINSASLASFGFVHCWWPFAVILLCCFFIPLTSGSPVSCWVSSMFIF